MKILQLYDTIMVRHGLMLVGPTGGGKTKNYQILAKAISALKGTNEIFQHVKYDILNPKSITMGQLYGFVENSEW
jgi:dynein heavy chain, axonemal